MKRKLTIYEVYIKGQKECDNVYLSEDEALFNYPTIKDGGAKIIARDCTLDDFYDVIDLMMMFDFDIAEIIEVLWGIATPAQRNDIMDEFALMIQERYDEKRNYR